MDSESMEVFRAELESAESQLLQARAETEEAREARRIAEVGLESLRKGANELITTCKSFRAMLHECQTSIAELENQCSFRRHEAAQPAVRQQQKLLKAQMQESEIRSEVQKAQAQLEIALNERKKLADQLKETRAEIDRAQGKETPSSTYSSPTRRSLADTEALARQLSETSPQTQVYTMIDSDDETVDESQAGGSRRNSLDISWNTANFAASLGRRRTSQDSSSSANIAAAAVDRLSQRSTTDSLGAALGADSIDSTMKAVPEEVPMAFHSHL